MPGPRNASAFADQRLDIRVRLADRVSEKTNHSGIRHDSAVSLSDNRCPLFNRIAQLAAAIVTMHRSAKPVAFLQIRHARGTYAVARSRALDRRPLHRRYRLARIKPKLGVKRKRPVVKGCLQQSSALETAFRGARKHRFHKRASDALILDLGIDRNRPNPRNRRALVKTVAAQNLPARFGNHAIETRMS